MAPPRVGDLAGVALNGGGSISPVAMRASLKVRIFAPTPPRPARADRRPPCKSVIVSSSAASFEGPSKAPPKEYFVGQGRAYSRGGSLYGIDKVPFVRIDVGCRLRSIEAVARSP